MKRVAIRKIATTIRKTRKRKVKIKEIQEIQIRLRIRIGTRIEKNDPRKGQRGQKEMKEKGERRSERSRSNGARIQLLIPTATIAAP